MVPQPLPSLPKEILLEVGKFAAMELTYAKVGNKIKIKRICPVCGKCRRLKKKHFSEETEISRVCSNKRCKEQMKKIITYIDPLYEFMMEKTRTLVLNPENQFSEKTIYSAEFWIWFWENFNGNEKLALLHTKIPIPNVAEHPGSYVLTFRDNPWENPTAISTRNSFWKGPFKATEFHEFVKKIQKRRERALKRATNGWYNFDELKY